MTRLSCFPAGLSDFDLEPLSLQFFFSFSKQGSLPKTGLDKVRAFCSTKSEISSMQTSLASELRIRSALSRQLACNFGGSLSIIFRMLSGLSNLLEWPIALRVFVQLESKTAKPSRASASSALMTGPLVTLSTYAIAILCFCPNLLSKSFFAFTYPSSAFM